MSEPISLTLRPLQEHDIERCAQFMVQTPLWIRYDVTYQNAVERFRSGLVEKAVMIVAEPLHVLDTQPADVLGLIWLTVRGAFDRSGYIPLLGVAPDARGQGVGAALINNAERYFRPLTRDVFLLCSDFNINAQRFYIRQGYQQVGVLPGYVLPDVAELIYRKQF